MTHCIFLIALGVKIVAVIYLVRWNKLNKTTIRINRLKTDQVWDQKSTLVTRPMNESSSLPPSPSLYVLHPPPLYCPDGIFYLYIPEFDILFLTTTINVQSNE